MEALCPECSEPLEAGDCGTYRRCLTPECPVIAQYVSSTATVGIAMAGTSIDTI